MRKRILFIFLLVLCLCAVPVSAAALGKVSGVKAKQSGEKVKVTWNTAAGAKGYQVYQKTGSEKFHRIKTTGKKSYTVRGQCGQFTVNLRKIVRFYPNYIL